MREKTNQGDLFFAFSAAAGTCGIDRQKLVAITYEKAMIGEN